ncbi:MAG: PP2C family protein-serine/threonine phosphatase, partial [Rhodospirillaceae bacterium]
MSPSASLLHSSILDQLGLVADMTRIFALDPDDSDALSVGLSQVAKHVRAEAASLFLLENNATELVCRACFGPVDITGLRLPAETGIVGRTVAENAAQSVRDVANDPDFGAQVDEKTGFTTRSILCAPLSVRDERLGAIEVINKTGFADQPGDGLFDEEDLKLLEVLAASTALALSNSRLTVSAFEQERLAREVELAAEIQRGLLPALGAPEAAIHGINLPARDVSGDFFDHLVDPMGRLWFCVGDVSGKGMNAALMMAKTASLFRVLARTSASPGR